MADELEALAHFIRHRVKLARNKAGSDALTTYALAQRLARRPETADPAPHVDQMRDRARHRVSQSQSEAATDVAGAPVVNAVCANGVAVGSWSKPRAGASEGAPAHLWLGASDARL